METLGLNGWTLYWARMPRAEARLLAMDDARSREECRRGFASEGIAPGLAGVLPLVEASLSTVVSNIASPVAASFSVASEELRWVERSREA